jgi:four helix bundle protein
MQDFTKMRSWIAARDFFVEVYDVTKSFPREELFGFTSQLRRASRSVAANIAEGSGYNGELDSARFYRTGFGSSSECYSDLYLARAVDLLSCRDFDRLESKLLPARRQLSRLIATIDARHRRR